MAIAFNSVTSNFFASAPSPHAANHTVTGSNTILFVNLQDVIGDTITGITYNGVSMTQVKKQQWNPNGAWTYVYMLVAPTSGTNSVSISFSGGNQAMAYNFVSYTGAKQTAQPDASTSGNETAVSHSLNLTTIANNCWSIFARRTDGTFSSASNVTLRSTYNQAYRFGDSNGVITPAGSYTQSEDDTGVSNSAQIMVSFAPSISSSPSPRLFMTMGVGR